MPNIIFRIILLCWTLQIAYGSSGDRSQFFVNCVRGCKHKNCTDDGIEFLKPIDGVRPQEYMNHLLLWSCEDECSYSCMWRTTYAFIARNWSIPQFYGKWPFKRIWGIQEPASVFFSLLNFYAHWYMIKQFRKSVRSDSPLYYMWHIFCLICLNGWIWSIVFHTRDYPITELFDYTFAYSIILASCTCMIIRMLHRYSNAAIRTAIMFTSLLYFINHFAFLSVGKFDYSYNMMANVITGLIGGIGWLAWYVLHRKRTYAWKMLTFQLLAGASLALELNDFPPILWAFDAHALWHLATAPLTILFYSFLIDDCKALRKEKFEPEDEKEKLI